jgi:hypothetical protein
MMVGSISPLLIHNQAIDGRLAANQRDMDDSVGYHTGVIEAFQSLGSPCYEQNWNQMSVFQVRLRWLGAGTANVWDSIL